MTDNPIEVPDFSGDDFAQDKDILKARKLAQVQQQLIEDSLAIVKKELNVEESSHKNLKMFAMFKNLKATLIESFQTSDSSPKLIVAIVEYLTSYQTAKVSMSGTNMYFFGYIKLSKNFPSTYICKESIREKIVNLFLKSDTDLSDHKKFSRKFNLITKDKNRFTDLIRFKNLDELTKFPEMEVEFQENSCLFRNSRNPITPHEAVQFSELAKTLISVFN